MGVLITFKDGKEKFFDDSYRMKSKVEFSGEFTTVTDSDGKKHSFYGKDIKEIKH